MGRFRLRAARSASSRDERAGICASVAWRSAPTSGERTRAAEDGAPVVEAAAGDGGEQLGRRAQRPGPLAAHDDDERREHAVVEHRLPPRASTPTTHLRARLARLRLALGVAEARVHVEQPHAALERRRLLRAARERRRVPRKSVSVGRRRLQPDKKTRDADSTSASSSVARVSIVIRRSSILALSFSPQPKNCG